MLPGVALATVLSLPVLIGGALRRHRHEPRHRSVCNDAHASPTTRASALLFVSMLAQGVIIISHSGSFATDATAILFGDILAISAVDLVLLAAAAAVGLIVAILFHRSFVALSLDVRIASVLGLRPQLAQAALVGLVTPGRRRVLPGGRLDARRRPPARPGGCRRALDHPHPHTHGARGRLRL